MLELSSVCLVYENGETAQTERLERTIQNAFLLYSIYFIQAVKLQDQSRRPNFFSQIS